MNHSLEDPGFSSQRHPHRGDGRYHTSQTDEDEDDDDEGDDEDSLLDNEVAAAIDAGQRDPLRQFGVFEDFRFSSAMKAAPMGKRHAEMHPKPSASYGLPASYQRDAISRPALDNHGHVGGRAAHARRSLGRTLKQLPPIARDDLPERPSAPSPSLTPPGEDEELDSAGEPVDFIDAA